MHLRHLRLLDFRSWPLLELDLEPGVTTLVGRNGHGKTNVLEAIGVLASLRSHRVASDAPMIRTGSETALIGTLAHNAGRELTVELALNSAGGPASTRRRAGAWPTSSGWCIPSSSLPRIWDWSGASPPSVGVSSTSS